MSAADKVFSTLQARAALLGYTCTHTAAGNIVLSMPLGGAWIFGSIEKADAWLDRLAQPSTEVPA